MTQRKLKEGAIKRRKSALLGANWKDCYAYLFSDSTFVWYNKKGDTKPLGSVVLKFVAPYVCAGEMTLKMPIERPSLPSKTSVEQLLAIGKNAKAEDVLWFLFPDADLEAWVEEMLKTVPKVNPPNEVLQGGTIESQPGVTTVIEKHYDHGGYYSGWNGFGHGYFPDSNNTPILPNDGRDSGLGGDAKTESDDNNSKADEGGGGDFGSDNNDTHIGAVSDPHHAEKPTGVHNESDNNHSKADEGGGGDFSSDNNDTHVGAVSDPHPHHAEKPEEHTRAPEDPNVHAENTNPFTDSDDKNPFDNSDEINTGHVTHTVEQINVTHTVEHSGGTIEISHSAGDTGGDHSGGIHSGGHSDGDHSGGTHSGGHSDGNHSGGHHHADDVHHHADDVHHHADDVHHHADDVHHS